jgi:hypothetical protein
VCQIYSLGIQIVLEVHEVCVLWQNVTDLYKFDSVQDCSNVKGKRCKSINTFSKNQSKNPSENIPNLNCNSNIHIGISLIAALNRSSAYNKVQ